MIEKICKNCIFFNHTISLSDGVLPLGHCSSENIDPEFNSDCESTIRENWDKKAGENNSSLIVRTDEPRHVLIFGENFGCIHFETRGFDFDKKELHVKRIIEEIEYYERVYSYRKNESIISKIKELIDLKKQIQ